MSYKPFKMKGHTLPGINQRKADRTADGRPGSSALQKKEGYNPDGSVDKNSERYKKAMANTKKSDARKARENELRNTMKTGGDVEAKRAKTELMSKGSISMDEKRRRDAENKKKEGGSSAVKLLGRKKKKSEGGVSRSVTKTSGYGLQPTVTQTSSTKKDGKFVRTTTNTADRPLAKEKHEYLKKEGKFPSAQAEADHAKKNKVYSSTITKQSTKKGKKTFTAADGNPKYMTKTKTKKDGTVKTKKKRYRKNVFKGQPGVRPL